MDLRDNTYTNVADLIKTLDILSQLDNIGAELVAVEVKRYLKEAAAYLETFVLPKIESKTPHVDLRGNGLPPRIATFVGATSDPEPLAAEPEPVPSFMSNHK